MNRKLTRQEAFELISGERDYQEATGRSILAISNPPLEWSAIANDYLSEAFDAAQVGDNERSMAFLRRVGAICVAAIEQHGALPREGSEGYAP